VLAFHRPKYVSRVRRLRVIDLFINELDLAALGFEGMLPATTPCLSSRDAAEDLSVWLSQPHPVEPPPRA
jgi:hypothetical protein